MIENSGRWSSATNEWLTVAARDNAPTDSFIPGDPDVVTLVLRIKGSDLSAFRAGRLTLEQSPDAGRDRRVLSTSAERTPVSNADMYNRVWLDAWLCRSLPCFLLAGCESRDVEKDLKIVDVHTGWYDAGIVAGGKNKLVPSISLELQNVSDRDIASVQMNAVFHRVGEERRLGRTLRPRASTPTACSRAPPGNIVLRSTPGLHRQPAAHPDAAEQRVRRRPGRDLRQARIAHVGQDGRIPDRPPAPDRITATPNSQLPSRGSWELGFGRWELTRRLSYNPGVTTTTTAAAQSLERRLGPLDAAAIIVSNVIGGGILFSPPQIAASVPSALAVPRDVGRRRPAGVRGRDGLRGARRAAAARRRRVRLPARRVRPLAGFLTGWTSFVAGFSGAIAASAVVLAFYLVGSFPAPRTSTPLLAVPIIPGTLVADVLAADARRDRGHLRHGLIHLAASVRDDWSANVLGVAEGRGVRPLHRVRLLVRPGHREQPDAGGGR